MCGCLGGHSLLLPGGKAGSPGCSLPGCCHLGYSILSLGMHARSLAEGSQALPEDRLGAALGVQLQALLQQPALCEVEAPSAEDVQTSTRK